MGDDGPVLTVVVPTYGRPTLLDACLASIRADGGDRVAVIVVDDASPEPVRLDGRPGLRVLRLDVNTGPAGARNAGLAVTTTDLVCFADDDDGWPVGSLDARLASVARSDIGLVQALDLDTGARVLPIPTEGFDRWLLTTLTPHLGCVTLRRTSCLPFDPSYRAAEDVDWWIRMEAAGRLRRVTVVDAPGYSLRTHPAERATHGPTVRLDASRRLLDAHATWFRRHRRARAFRWLRVGLYELQVGSPRRGVLAMARSLAIRPSLRSANRLARALGALAPRRARRPQG